MFSVRSLIFKTATAALLISFADHVSAKSCVWKVTGPGNKVLYLGGSIHALRSTDYPLPPEFNRAFDLSERLVFEGDRKSLHQAEKEFATSGQYSRGDNLKNHVDPRTYDYLRRFFKLVGVPEEKYSRYRPWFLALLLQAPQLNGLSPDLGVEGFLERRAHANHKLVSGLESARDGVEVFSGLSDRQSEIMLLLTFIPQKGSTGDAAAITQAWRRGDSETIARQTRAGMASFPGLEQRVLDQRNQNWIPKIEKDFRSGHTYFVVVGAAHMGGPHGVIALLRGRGYQVDQL